MIASRNRHSKRLKFRRLILFVIGLVLVLSSLRLLSNYFRVRNVECYTQYGLCQEDLYHAVSPLLNRPIFNRGSSAGILNGLRQNLEIKSAVANYKFPQTVAFEIVLRKPMGQLGSQSSEVYTVSDEEGLVIRLSPRSNLPLLFSDQTYKPGDRLSDLQLQALKIISLVNQIDAKITEGVMTDHQLTIKSPGPVILLDLDKIPAQWYPTLQVLLARSKILSNPPKTIDMRFSNPTISF
ncbi:hypothetical protein A2397_00805 [Candidatus Amesbacteria bacterium RIFOXYB1_FULL_44_23]|uniref:POTRA domain-containing protein n=1 Tax=Candidatus Amesbacteria bacterium RIFOXYB1_FULL_44_23 TaxID=1797263 RepID=A0A1F4ZWC2_9BACT|nr:MAG: hypothetical protein A2397_00805 [Candidatus Amesbacteria bacterium RIFOXYB1_FULL_44_23]